MSTGKTQLVTFRLGDDLFAADIFTVERVLRHAKPRPVPDLPPWMEGVLDYEGRVVPVIDLRARFNVEGRRPDDARILVFAVDDQWIAMTVDAVQEVTAVDAAQIEAPPAIFRGLAKEYLSGIVRRIGGMLVVLNVRHLLTSQERLQLERAVGAGVAQ
jgi:purine-binding chemotaxis protein CheW